MGAMSSLSFSRTPGVSRQERVEHHEPRFRGFDQLPASLLCRRERKPRAVSHQHPVSGDAGVLEALAHQTFAPFSAST